MVKAISKTLQPNETDLLRNTLSDIAPDLVPKLLPNDESRIIESQLVPNLTLKLPITNNHVSAIYENCRRSSASCSFDFPVDTEAEPSKSTLQFYCTLKINDVFVASGSGTSKKEAKFDTARKAILRLVGKPTIPHSGISTLKAKMSERPKFGLFSK